MAGSWLRVSREAVWVPLLVVVSFAAGLSLREGPASAQGKPSGNGDCDGDGKLALADVICLLQYIFVPGSKAPEPIVCPPGGLPATGQTKCYSVGGGHRETNCASAWYPGEDGLFQAGCPTEGRFVDNGDGSVTDNCTGLMWQQETAPGLYAWGDALSYCWNLELAGHTDWRLPNVRELQSIVDYGRWDLAIDPVFSAVSARYWSSSTYIGGLYLAWHVGFWDGSVLTGHKDKDNSYYYVRAVRG